MPRPKRVAECHPERRHHANGLCQPCYKNTRRADCHPDKPHVAHGLCRAYYNETRKEEATLVRKQHYTENKQYYINKSDEYRRKNPEWLMWYSAKKRAKQRGLTFHIEISDVLLSSHCPVLRIPLIPFSGRLHPNSPSIDRVDNTKGYVKGNIVVISMRANLLKNTATLDELKRLANFYTTYMEGEDLCLI